MERSAALSLGEARRLFNLALSGQSHAVEGRSAVMVDQREHLRRNLRF
jgi:hypothetical protein